MSSAAHHPPHHHHHHRPPPASPPPPPAPPSSSSPPPPPPPKPLDLHVTVVSAKHLKNVNWCTGDLKPYVVVYLHPDRRAATKPDDSGGLRPVWNERLTLPLPPHRPIDHLLLTLDVFHSRPSETPKPLVGTARSPLQNLLEPSGPSSPIRTLELRRPSGRPQGKIRIKVELRDRPPPPPASTEADQVSNLPQFPGYFYSSAPPQPPVHQNLPFLPRSYYWPLARQSSPMPYSNYGAYGEQYSGHYPPQGGGGGYSAPPQPQPSSGYYVREGNGGPSAPSSEYSSEYFPVVEHRRGVPRVGMGGGSDVGAATGAFGGLSLGEGSSYEDGKIGERAESDVAGRDEYGNYLPPR